MFPRNEFPQRAKMQIHQLQLIYQPEDDRVLFRLSTSERAEFRFWLTRRCVKLLWQALLKMLERDRVLATQFDPQARREVLGMQHEGYVSKGDFTRGFDSAPAALPLGENPLLVTKFRTSEKPDGVQILSLYPTQGQGADIALDTRLLHILCKMLRDAVAKSDWDMVLQLAHEVEAVPEQQKQKLN